jgi:hypothetical protein
MALICDDHPVLTGNSQGFWRDELKNTRILLFELDKAINALNKNEIKSYTIDTGQNHFTAQRHDLPQLYMQRQALIKQIEELEIKAGEDTPVEKIHQVIPSW